MFENYVNTGNFMLDGVLKGVLKKLSKLDLNHNKKADVEEVAEVLKKNAPALAALNDAVDFRLLAALLSNHPAIKDKAVFQNGLVALGEIIEVGAKLLPKEEEPKQ